MHTGTDFMTDIAEFDRFPARILWRAEFPVSVQLEEGVVVLTLPFRAYCLDGALVPVEDQPLR